MTTKDQRSQASDGTLGLTSTVLLVSTLLVLALGIVLGTKSPERSCSTSTQAQRLKQGCGDGVKQKDVYGIRKPGYGQTRH